MNLNNKIKADLFRYTGTSTLKALLKAWRSPTFRFLFFFRMVTSSKKYSFKWILSFPFYRRHFLKYGLQIPTSVKIGKGLLLPHFGGIVINSGSVIGENCNILQGVTLGNINTGKNKGAPIIGNEVYIGPGAIIVGGIKVGEDVLIAGNAFVNFDVPPHSIVIGNPGTIIAKENATKNYISRKST